MCSVTNSHLGSYLELINDIIMSYMFHHDCSFEGKIRRAMS